MAYELEDNVPIPEKNETKYPFANMQVGQSFVVNDGTKSSSIYSAIVKFRKEHPTYKFVRRQDSNGNIRVWRTE